ncbi:poly [ADP-ribose] polymerase 1 [Ixodes scapularis]
MPPQSPMFDGKVPHWYHFMCFFSKQRPKSVGDIDKYGTLRYEDQKRIQEKIESKMAAGTTADDLRDFSTEYAKSNKSTCKGCSEKIAKGEVRISKLDYDGAFSKMRGPVPQWYHVDCFVKKRDDLDYTLGADSIPGFMSLGVDDQRMLKEKIKKLDRKRKPKAADETDGPPAKQAKVPEDPEEEKALKKQSDLVYKLRDDLQKNLSKKELQELLEFNEIDIPAGESRILDLLGDCMAFGCLERCPECKEGQLKLRTDAYACTGNISGWTKCQYLTQDPQRTAFKVPPEFKEAYPFLKKYKYVARKRVFPKNPAKPSEPSTSANGKAGKDLPLDGIEVALGKTSASADELKQKLILLGAKPVSKVSEKTLCLISTEEDVKKKSKRVKDAELHNVHVVSEDFIDHLAKSSGAAEAVVGQFKIAPWGGDAGSKIEKYKTKSQMDRMFAKSGPSTMKLTVKGLAVVEPESGLADVAHVYTRDKEIFSSVLGMVDVSRGTNSYYKLQLLESDQRNRYWVYRAWGRVGTSVGSNKLEQMDTLEEAKHHFKALFEEKTGNPWSQRKDMVKQPNRFYPLELDYGQESGGKMEKMKPNKNSKLHHAVQELICMIFDMDNFKKTMVEFEIDLTKMPLGKLSKRQIQQAYSVLTELSEVMDRMFAKSGPSTMKLTVKGLAVVEPESGLADVAHVYTRDKEIFSSVLGMVDVSRGTNSYYKLQLLESDQRNRYWVYRAWGRVGTSVGSNKLEQMDTLEEAKHHFKALFEEKTGNPWSQRKDMVKQPNRFYPLELDYGQESGGKMEKMKPNKNSKLHHAVQELICMIFDMDNFKKTMVEFEIDLTKMPLGKLSKRQIQQAYSVLTELSELIKNGGSESKFLDASNRFYTLIPHDFGMRKPTILNNDELIKQKIGMVDSLLEIEVAYSMLKAEATETGTHPVDFHYSQLKAGIEVVWRDSDEFALMSKYVETTHAETHRSYKLQILELFKVAKDGEAKRYKPFKKLPNRKLLWHGSRLSNYAGILSQGLRIAPPEAPVTGYMFGKGIYFADMVSKSANYCCTSPSNPVGLLLLCEVALGNM